MSVPSQPRPMSRIWMPKASKRPRKLSSPSGGSACQPTMKARIKIAWPDPSAGRRSWRANRLCRREDSRRRQFPGLSWECPSHIFQFRTGTRARAMGL